MAIIDSVLQFAQNIGSVAQPSLQPAIEQYRAILADKQAEAHERLEQVKAYVVAAARQLEHQRSQVGQGTGRRVSGGAGGAPAASCRKPTRAVLYVLISPHPRPPPQLGVLLEWCRIRQAGLIGQLRAGFCAHSVLDQLADVALRGAAVLRWEPELRRMQGEAAGGGAGVPQAGQC